MAVRRWRAPPQASLAAAFAVAVVCLVAALCGADAAGGSFLAKAPPLPRSPPPPAAASASRGHHKRSMPPPAGGNKKPPLPPVKAGPTRRHHKQPPPPHLPVPPGSAGKHSPPPAVRVIRGHHKKATVPAPHPPPPGTGGSPRRPPPPKAVTTTTKKGGHKKVTKAPPPPRGTSVLWPPPSISSRKRRPPPPHNGTGGRGPALPPPPNIIKGGVPPQPSPVGKVDTHSFPTIGKQVAPSSAPASGGGIVSPVPTGSAGLGDAGMPKLNDARWLSLHNQYVSQALGTKYVDVIFVGDSITEGWEETLKGYPVGLYHGAKAQLQKLMADLGNVQGKPLSYFDFGIAQDTSRNVLWRLLNLGTPELPSSLSVKVVVLCIGINDLLTNSSISTTAANIAKLVVAIRESHPNTAVLVNGLLPESFLEGGTPNLSQPIGWTGLVNAQLQPLNGGLIKYIDCSSRFLTPSGTLNTQLYVKDSFQLLHLSQYGYGQWASCMMPFIAKLLSTTTGLQP
eukprot:SM000027S09658  [mRNA]  locus=s27:600785:603889:+ [translate_table: standard]